jgi:hypothetical protein
MLADNQSLREISQALGRSPSTISRELKRNASPEYQLYLSHRAGCSGGLGIHGICATGYFPLFRRDTGSPGMS